MFKSPIKKKLWNLDAAYAGNFGEGAMAIEPGIVEDAVRLFTGAANAFWIFFSAPVSNVVILASLISGLWVWNNHRKEDRFFPKIEFLVDIRFKIKRDDLWIAEAVCGIKNNGISRFSIEDLNFEVRGLKLQSPVADGNPEIGRQTEFPDIVKSGKWFSSELRKTFVEAGTTQIYRHVFSVPLDYDALLIHGSVLYAKLMHFRPVRHSADRVLKVPGDYSEAATDVINDHNRIRFAEPIEERWGDK